MNEDRRTFRPFRWFRRWWLQRYTDNQLAQQYVSAGATVGDACSYCYLGEPIGMKRIVHWWGEVEREYARRGYQTISLDRFIECGGYGKSVDDVLLVKRKAGEDPVYHAGIYVNRYLGKVASIINPAAGISIGKYVLPSTENVD